MKKFCAKSRPQAAFFVWVFPLGGRRFAVRKFCANPCRSNQAFPVGEGVAVRRRMRDCTKRHISPCCGSCSESLIHRCGGPPSPKRGRLGTDEGLSFVSIRLCSTERDCTYGCMRILPLIRRMHPSLPPRGKPMVALHGLHGEDFAQAGDRWSPLRSHGGGSPRRKIPANPCAF